MDWQKRAVEILVERVRAYQQMQQPEPPAQDDLRAAYEAVINAPDFLSAYQQFEAQYGAEAFTRQQTLHLRRSIRDVS